MLVVSAVFYAKINKEDELKNILKSLISFTEKEEGSICYNFHQNLQDKREFFFYEKFRNQEAFDIHCKSDYFQKAQEIFAELIDRPVDISFYEELGFINK